MPFLAPIAILGGIPSKIPDFPASIVIGACFLAIAITHIILFRRNRERGHKFLVSIFFIGLSMSRVATMSLRCAWSIYPNNINLAIASQIFNAAGVFLLFLANVVLTQRIVRAAHPSIDTNLKKRKIFLGFGIFIYFTTFAMFVCLIMPTIWGFFTTNAKRQEDFKILRRIGSIWVAFVAGLPIPMNIISMIIKSRTLGPLGVTPNTRRDMRVRIAMVLFTTVLLAFGACFRAGTSFYPRPRNHPAWYHSRAAFYCTYFLIEWITVAFYAIMRVDQKFWVPHREERLRILNEGYTDDKPSEQISEA